VGKLPWLIEKGLWVRKKQFIPYYEEINGKEEQRNKVGFLGLELLTLLKMKMKRSSFEVA
jgi:hypothetical protein